MRAFVLVAMLLAIPAWFAPARAADSTILVRDGWSRETPRGAKVGAGYLVIENHGDAQDRLVSAEVSVAGRVEVHETSESGGVARMRQITDLPVPAHGTVEFRPGGLHLMLTDLRSPLREGDRLEGVLVFERAGKIPIQLQVRKVGAGAISGHGHGTH